MSLKGYAAYFWKKNYYGWKRCIWSQSYQWRRLLQNLLQSWDLLCTLDIRKSSHASFPALILLKPNNHYNHGFPNTYDYNHYVYSDYLVSSVRRLLLLTLYVIEYLWYYCNYVNKRPIKYLKLNLKKKNFFWDIAILA